MSSTCIQHARLCDWKGWDIIPHPAAARYGLESGLSLIYICSTAGMAEDVIALLDYIGWTAKRDLHVVGISLGGMIAQGSSSIFPSKSNQPTTPRTGN